MGRDNNAVCEYLTCSLKLMGGQLSPPYVDRTARDEKNHLKTKNWRAQPQALSYLPHLVIMDEILIRSSVIKLVLLC